MSLEALEFIERRQRRVRIIEVHDEADRDQPVVVMIKERAAARRAAERPAERVLDAAGREFRGVDLPDLLEADAEFLGIAAGVELVFGDELLGERAARALGNSMPRVKLSFGSPSRPTPMSPVAIPTTSPLSP